MLTDNTEITLSDLDLEQHGLIMASSLYYNLSYEDLFEHETRESLPDLEKARLTKLDAVSIDTGAFTGRSPKDKYIVRDETTEDTVWWSEQGSDNKAISTETWSALKDITVEQLNGQTLYVIDGFCGANASTRMSVRLVTELAWQAHFFKNMFIRPTEEELKSFTPDWTILNACKTSCQNYEELGIRSEVYIAFNVTERMTVIGGTWYGGEIKKGIFSIMNYFLPLKEIGAFHCSANQGESGDTALFFGLSGTGKTTLSADPKRYLIGDDEHGWDQDGIFNFEGGCYAKTIDLSEEKEPDIYKAIRRNALLENVVVDETGVVDFSSGEKTQNTRVSYPIEHIDKIVKPVSKGAHPKKIIFLTCDAFGVLPPVSKLSKEQAMYQYLSGYTAKVAGTELGVTEPTATFSACFGQPFLLLHPTKYAEILGQKMDEHGATAYLVNTGWCGGAYGVGHRISLPYTRTIIDVILSGELDEAEMEITNTFQLLIPRTIKDVPSELLRPRNAWGDEAAFEAMAQKLATMFQDNFKKFAGTDLGASLLESGPKA